MMARFARNSTGAFLNNRNFLINPNFLYSQRSATFTAATAYKNDNDAYIMDRWLLLSDGNNVVNIDNVFGGTAPPDAFSALRATVATANKKFGFVQIMENAEVKNIIGSDARNCSLSFQAQNAGDNATLDSMRAGILRWSGTPNVLTTNLVSAWNATDVNPTLAANWSFESVPVTYDLGAGGWNRFLIENVAISTGTTSNIAVFFWCNDTDATLTDKMFLSATKLEQGAFCTPNITIDIADDFVQCQRFFKTIGINSAQMALGCGLATSTTTASCPMYLGSLMIAPPTVTYSNVTASIELLVAGVGAVTSSALATSLITTQGLRIDATIGAASLALGDATLFATINNEKMFLDSEF